MSESELEPCSCVGGCAMMVMRWVEFYDPGRDYRFVRCREKTTAPGGERPRLVVDGDVVITGPEA